MIKGAFRVSFNWGEESSLPPFLIRHDNLLKTWADQKKLFGVE